MKIVLSILLLSSISFLMAASNPENLGDSSSLDPKVNVVSGFSCVKEMLQKRAFPLIFRPRKDSEDGDIVVIEEKTSVRSTSGGNFFFPGKLLSETFEDGVSKLVIHVPMQTRAGLSYNVRKISFDEKGQIISDQCVSTDLQTLEAVEPPA